MGEGGRDEEVASSEKNRIEDWSAKIDTLWGRTYLYSPYKGVNHHPPPPPPGLVSSRYLNVFVGREDKFTIIIIIQSVCFDIRATLPILTRLRWSNDRNCVFFSYLHAKSVRCYRQF